MNATVVPNAIPVRYSIHPDIGLEFISFDIPNGWDDVKRVCKKVLTYDGRPFTFSCWNSDRMECVFRRALNETVAPFATISNKSS